MQLAPITKQLQRGDRVYSITRGPGVVIRIDEDASFYPVYVIFVGADEYLENTPNEIFLYTLEGRDALGVDNPSQDLKLDMDRYTNTSSFNVGDAVFAECRGTGVVVAVFSSNETRYPVRVIFNKIASDKCGHSVVTYTPDGKYLSNTSSHPSDIVCLDAPYHTNECDAFDNYYVYSVYHGEGKAHTLHEKTHCISVMYRSNVEVTYSIDAYRTVGMIPVVLHLYPPMPKTETETETKTDNMNDIKTKAIDRELRRGDLVYNDIMGPGVVIAVVDNTAMVAFKGNAGCDTNYATTTQDVIFYKSDGHNLDGHDADRNLVFDVSEYAPIISDYAVGDIVFTREEGVGVVVAVFNDARVPYPVRVVFDANFPIHRIYSYTANGLYLRTGIHRHADLNKSTLELKSDIHVWSNVHGEGVVVSAGSASSTAVVKYTSRIGSEYTINESVDSITPLLTHIYPPLKKIPTPPRIDLHVGDFFVTHSGRFGYVESISTRAESSYPIGARIFENGTDNGDYYSYTRDGRYMSQSSSSDIKYVISVSLPLFTKTWTCTNAQHAFEYMEWSNNNAVIVISPDDTEIYRLYDGVFHQYTDKGIWVRTAKKPSIKVDVQCYAVELDMWHKSMPKTGKLCWVDYGDTELCIELITSVVLDADGVNYTYKTRSGAAFINAIPLSNKEITEYFTR